MLCRPIHPCIPKLMRSCDEVISQFDAKRCYMPTSCMWLFSGIGRSFPGSRGPHTDSQLDGRERWSDRGMRSAAVFMRQKAAEHIGLDENVVQSLGTVNAEVSMGYRSLFRETTSGRVNGAIYG